MLLYVQCVKNPCCFLPQFLSFYSHPPPPPPPWQLFTVPLSFCHLCQYPSKNAKFLLTLCLQVVTESEGELGKWRVKVNWANGDSKVNWANGE